MHLKNWTIAKRINRGQMAYCLYLVLLAAFSLNAALAAEAPNAQLSTTHSIPAQTAVNGSIRQVTHDPKSGYQLELDGAQGGLTANLGPKLSHDLEESLAPGATVQISGTMQTTGGKQYLSAHTVTIDGKQTAIRNDYGFLLNATPQSRTHNNQTTAYRSSK